MSVLKIVLGFLPWVAFSLISGWAGPDGVAIAALVSLILAAVFVARSIIRHESVKLVEASAVVTFAAIGAWALIDPASGGFLDFYGRGVVTLVLAAVIAAAWRGVRSPSSTPGSRSRRSTGTRPRSTRSTAGSPPPGRARSRSWGSGT
jgi:hypothetical protein